MKILTLLALLCSLSGGNINSHSVYMRAMEVTNINYDTEVVQCIDSVGYEWEFVGCEDYWEGDVICCLMDDNGTPESILDDIIVNTNYSGYVVKR